ncbi:hypothetical protein [uncultured Adlercreutzia sp.]|uniref:hypothetical protein n=1 Tax=uncultured Adlercreutzia sp. TaxID=875803 RepID=UPI0025A669EC|nr:hypothetical protein [uncultured Adlercreutzia sp.]
MGSPNNELVTHDTPSTACFQHLQDFATIVIRRRLSEFCAQQRHLSLNIRSSARAWFAGVLSSGKEHNEGDDGTEGEGDGKFKSAHFFSPDLLRRTFVRSYNRTNKSSCQQIFQTNVRLIERMQHDPESNQAATGGS